MKTNDQLIKAIAESQLFKNYQRAFSDAMGLPLSLKAADDWDPAFRGVSKENPFCRMVVGQSRACSACLRLQEKLCHSANESGKALQCAYGMMEVAVPVRLGNKPIGFLRTGQVLGHAPSEEGIEATFEHLQAAGAKFNMQKTRRMFIQTRVLQPGQLDSIKLLLCIFAEHLALKSNLLAIGSRNTEPAAVVRTREFVEANYGDDISLADAAHAAHTSTFYLCKLLRKSIDVSFTELLCRRRLEGAKQLLANPNLRISEIAYEVGFQSLTHFNRIFKKLTGESPTEFRAAAPVAQAA